MKACHPIKTRGNNLTGLWRPSFVKADQRLYVFGGGGNVTDELHYLDLLQMKWETVENPIGKTPSKRYGHSATSWKDTIIIFGGCNEFQEYCSDIHIYNIKTMTWYQPTIKGDVSPRYLHTATVYANKLYVYGGFAKSSDCTYVLDELCVLDLETMSWVEYHDMPPRYNHSSTLIENKMYIYAGKDEQGNTVSDLFVINLSNSPYTPHLVLNATQPCNEKMILLKSQHFCDTACGKLLMFGRYLINNNTSRSNVNNSNKSHALVESQTILDSTYSLWMLDLDTLQWERQECGGHFDVGGWNYFTVIKECSGTQDAQSEVSIDNLLFLGNTDPYRPQGYDHFRDALLIHGESLGLYNLSKPKSSEFAHLLNNSDLSDFTITTAEGKAIYVHQVILLARWPHFKRLSNKKKKEGEGESSLMIPETYEIVMLFLKFLYCDCLEELVSWQIVCKLLVMSNLYKVHRLKKLCCQRLFRNHMTIDSCGVIFEKAIMADETGLKLLALNFMFQHYGSLLKSNVFLALSLSTQEAFLEAVPEGAILEINRAKCSANRECLPISDNAHHRNTSVNVALDTATPVYGNGSNVQSMIPPTGYYATSTTTMNNHRSIINHVIPNTSNNTDIMIVEV
ncbi:hypothetical protein BDB01DRAFT_846788 [Pilobolus umbonatus]|nr:hypothetical protein BDB01DRAFT_846788 [Pilobolus umbonatus]